MGKSKEYYREQARKNRKVNKELSKLYRTIESRPGETFSEFKRRKKHEIL